MEMKGRIRECYYCTSKDNDFVSHRCTNYFKYDLYLHMQTYLLRSTCNISGLYSFHINNSVQSHAEWGEGCIVNNVNKPLTVQTCLHCIDYHTNYAHKIVLTV